MKPVQLVLGIHLHQPVGNFPDVLESSYQSAYLPFLQIFREFPSLKLVWHCTGALFQWLAEAHPEYLAMVRELVAEGRLEPLGGGIYEPIFPVIGPEERRQQIGRLSELIHASLDYEPRGLWLAERVWEPAIAGDLCRAGIRYVSLDDYHFLSAGFDPGQLDGYFMVEELDSCLGVFPISEPFRYLIPWAESGKIAAELRRLRDQGRRLVVMIDDGEKFGAWPGTFDWVYTRGWLREFFRLIEDNPELVTTTTFARYAAENPPSGRAALPGASYTEMGQWALPAERAARFESWKRRFEQDGSWEELKSFVRGGVWRNFLIKYPESNWLQKRILRLSQAFDTGAKRALPAYDRLLQAQCNDVFWHGVFGGLYLPHLRQAAYRNLLAAQTGLEHYQGRPSGGETEITTVDMDQDGADEVLLNHRDFFAALSPRSGGSLVELSFKPAGINLLNTVARWKEKYHLSAMTSRVVRVGQEAGPPAGANQTLVFDEEACQSCREMLARRLPGPLELMEKRFLWERQLWREPFKAEIRDGAVVLERPGTDFRFEKTITPLGDPAGLQIDYRWQSRPPWRGWLAVEWTLGIAGGDDFEKCCYPLMQRPAARGLGQPGGWDAVEGFTLENRRDGYRLDFICPVKIHVRHWPHETVSLSIDALEKTYQGLGLCLLVPVSEPAGSLRMVVRIEKI